MASNGERAGKLKLHPLTFEDAVSGLLKAKPAKKTKETDAAEPQNGSRSDKQQ